MLWRILYIASVGLFAVFAPSILSVRGRKFFVLLALIGGLLAAVVAAPGAFLDFGLISQHPGQAAGGMLAALLGFGLPFWGTGAITLALEAFNASSRIRQLGAIITAALLIPVALPLAFALTVMLTTQ
jgi:hypothetical protein